ncbi:MULTISPECIES: PilX N-terminal domain-containing pilus assembly protein [unclassified Alcanivorax]|jgi:Tfp pilus assembly protein PilX|uniref:PilX N-terminal domain-containing pilus assembly protein n=1 Tax=unclassified Alcanivorax TaxID=2638842 RepID=UPI0007C3FC22|nr:MULTISPECIES: PilX N-terminal domain-containing pilus assembly protein [unclassified Alcanivorax]KZX73930.1 hypothetical protein A3716_12990 [Alcanivorax sp. HI0011]KZX85570.1 hypothetical protein A3717_06040 [Alcanivorax sp. HI0013]KZY11882.1 hypothetical protein A3725_14660 [Alcanivorax sp. HI0035]MCP4996562.1 hypothetical protein [Gammaproteobacteria bacterium]KZX61643.1 hypothetical protein A3713_08790 [Alcanivorax sp. HI0003]
MKMNSLFLGNNQRGAALIVALLILVVVSVLGVSAMKTSMFAAKVATGTQADAMVFEAAESSVADMYNTLDNLDEVALTGFIVNQVVARRCLLNSGGRNGACNSGDSMDARKVITASAAATQNGFRLIPGNQVSTTGNTATFVDYSINVQGDAVMDGFNLNDRHLQQLLKTGILPGSQL